MDYTGYSSASTNGDPRAQPSPLAKMFCPRSQSSTLLKTQHCFESFEVWIDPEEHYSIAVSTPAYWSSQTDFCCADSKNVGRRALHRAETSMLCCSAGRNHSSTTTPVCPANGTMKKIRFANCTRGAIMCYGHLRSPPVECWQQGIERACSSAAGCAGLALLHRASLRLGL